MLDKSKFHCMLNWSHIAAAIFKAGFGYVGFLTFQEGIYGIIYLHVYFLLQISLRNLGNRL